MILAEEMDKFLGGWGGGIGIGIGMVGGGGMKSYQNGYNSLILYYVMELITFRIGAV